MAAPGATGAAGPVGPWGPWGPVAPSPPPFNSAIDKVQFCKNCKDEKSFITAGSLSLVTNTITLSPRFNSTNFPAISASKTGRLDTVRLGKLLKLIWQCGITSQLLKW